MKWKVALFGALFSSVGLSDDNLAKVVALQQAQISALIAQDKKHDENLAELNGMKSMLSRLWTAHQTRDDLNGSGTVVFDSLNMREPGTYLLSVIANQAGSSTTYSAIIVRTTSGVAGATVIVASAFDSVGSQIIKSVNTVATAAGGTAVSVAYSGFISSAAVSGTVWRFQ